MGGDEFAAAWSRLAHDVDGIDADAGRALHDAVAHYAAPIYVQVAGRFGVSTHHIVDTLSARPDTIVTTVIIDDPDDPDGPGAAPNPDVVVYVLPSRLDPTSVHPADRAALAEFDPDRTVVLVSGETRHDPPSLPTTVHPADGDQWHRALERCIAAALTHRARILTRTAASIPTAASARDLVETALEHAAAPR